MSIPALSSATRNEPLSGRENSVQTWELQQSLNALRGYERLATDGIFGPKTRAELEQFQRSMHLPVTGYPDAVTMEQLERAVSWVTDGTDPLADGPPPASRQTDASPTHPAPRTQWDDYARVQEQTLSTMDIAHTASRVATSAIDGALDLPQAAARVLERTAGGLGVLGSHRLNEIATQNADFVDAVTNVAAHPVRASEAVAKAMVVDAFARLQGRDGIRAGAKAVGRLVAEHGGQEFIERLTERVLADGVGEQLREHLESRLGVDLKVAGGLFTALSYTAEFQDVLAKAGDASVRLSEQNPALWRYLDGSTLDGQPVENLHMLWFLAEPIMEEIDTVVSNAIEAERATPR